MSDFFAHFSWQQNTVARGSMLNGHAETTKSEEAYQVCGTRERISDEERRRKVVEHTERETERQRAAQVQQQKVWDARLRASRAAQTKADELAREDAKRQWRKAQELRGEKLQERGTSEGRPPGDIQDSCSLGGGGGGGGEVVAAGRCNGGGASKSPSPPVGESDM